MLFISCLFFFVMNLVVIKKYFTGDMVYNFFKSLVPPVYSINSLKLCKREQYQTMVRKIKPLLRLETSGKETYQCNMQSIFCILLI